MIWFTADFHLSHKNIIKYCNRPFDGVEEMNNVILRNLKNMVKPGDTLYFLGDLTFDSEVARIFFEKFKKIQIHFIIGNHDSQKVIKLATDFCASVSQIKDIKIEGQAITLCHYAMRVWNRSHFNSWQLYGHSHGRVEPIGKQYDVGVDNNNFLPVSFDMLVKTMKSRPNNFNYIPREARS
ncbi:MAG: metallophosphoesterase [Promethearchaeota archaeon]